MQIFWFLHLRNDVTVGKINGKWEARSSGKPVDMMVDREDAGVVSKAQFVEDAEGPHGFFSDGKGGGTIADDFYPDQVL